MLEQGKVGDTVRFVVERGMTGFRVTTLETANLLTEGQT